MDKLKNKILTPLIAISLFTGGGVAVAALASAQTTTNTTTTATPSTTSATTADATTGSRPMGHAPLGGDGNVTAINGTTITMQEEADEGGATYTVDASNATVTKDGATASLSDIKVGDKIFTQGTTNGTSVTATTVSLGHPGGRGHDMSPTTTQ
jgi:hypothetical protein